MTPRVRVDRTRQIHNQMCVYGPGDMTRQKVLAPAIRLHEIESTIDDTNRRIGDRV
jgi:hypothetical protein